jgi:hypothetical protein
MEVLTQFSHPNQSEACSYYQAWAAAKIESQAHVFGLCLCLRDAAGAVAGYNAWFGYESDGGYGVVICRSYSPGATQLGAVATNLLRQIAAVA